MTRAGFEADRYRLTLYDRRSGTISTLTEELDYSIGNFDWAPDSRNIYFCVQDKGRYSIGRVSVRGGDARFVLTGGYDNNVRVSPDGKSLVFPRQRINAPTDLYRSSTSGSNVTRLTGINSEILEGLEMNPLEEFWFEGAGGRQVHGARSSSPPSSRRAGNIPSYCSYTAGRREPSGTISTTGGMSRCSPHPDM
jgi:dipeptidyl aminopeptidase/acylaminoacyl peptidase